ncbi:unnamed protein product [Ceratitis capitata]|uniref:(Mediterranean fruit fly) hypothetical protein n=1 Tax=Ceratitis capitata TaxID=7213 RepID=A0A811UTV6_CERCA|nr:unnamed protein product [Ceratitis capitata]
MSLEDSTTVRLQNPPWTLPPDCILLQLEKYKKEDTPKSVFMQNFQHIRNKYLEWSTLYTDGSKYQEITAFSIVNKHQTQTIAVLPHYSSVFTAKATAILYACKIARQNRGKWLICSDSLSTLTSIKT